MRSLLNWREGYESICREERNLAAILYHALLLPGNLERFLRAVQCDDLEFVHDQAGIFFEYAYLRDLWHERKGTPEQARGLILKLLDIPPGSALEGCSVEEFNRYFGAVPRPSSDKIQSPGNWSIGRYAPNIEDPNLFLAVCRFKWAFNAKPDIVIHTSRDAAVCIEAKYASVEGRYPTKAAEIAEFQRRGLDRVGQTELQTYILEELLGIQTRFLFLVQNEGARSETHCTVTWKDVFGALDLQGTPAFVHRWLDRL